MYRNLFSSMSDMLKYIKANAPLIHCITNPISINDCANILLALGARPIMAEHPGEVAEIVSIAKGLALNLGNITDARMDSMLIAARTAGELGIPVVLDLVGIGCSSLRREYAHRLLQVHVPNIIKGNISELRALLGLPITPGMGIEAGQKEMATLDNASAYVQEFAKIAREHHTALLATGPMDLLVNEHEAYAIANGTEALASITGTGCMCNVLIGACLGALHGMRHNASASDAPNARSNNATIPADIHAGLLACLLMGVAGEKAHHLYAAKGPGSFRTGLMDAMSRITVDDLEASALITQVACPST